MATKKVNIKLYEDKYMPTKQNGNWYDCLCREMVVIRDGKECFRKDMGIVQVKAGDTLLVKLGFATDMGKGYEAQLKPRSSTFKRYGLLLGNSVGLIDDTYCGDGDEWLGYFYCTRDARLPVECRLLQMTIEKSRPDINFARVETLGNENRGGYGTTGI